MYYTNSLIIKTGKGYVMKEIFISAAKYKTLEKEQGPEAALATLLHDIHSTGKLITGPSEYEEETPKGPVLKNGVFVVIEDINIAAGTGIGSMNGRGDDLKDAKADLLHNLLEPETSVPDIVDSSNTRIIVGSNILKPRGTVKVGP